MNRNVTSSYTGSQYKINIEKSESEDAVQDTEEILVDEVQKQTEGTDSDKNKMDFGQEIMKFIKIAGIYSHMPNKRMIVLQMLAGISRIHVLPLTDVEIGIRKIQKSNILNKLKKRKIKNQRSLISIRTTKNRIVFFFHVEKVRIRD